LAWAADGGASNTATIAKPKHGRSTRLRGICSALNVIIFLRKS
jgi:hypothetical protein